MERIREYMRLCDIQVGKTPAIILGSWDDTDDEPEDNTILVRGSHEQHASGPFIPAAQSDKKVMIV